MYMQDKIKGSWIFHGPLIFVRKINIFPYEEDGMVAWVTNPKDQRFEGSHTSGHCEVRFPASSLIFVRKMYIVLYEEKSSGNDGYSVNCGEQ